MCIAPGEGWTLHACCGCASAVVQRVHALLANMPVPSAAVTAHPARRYNTEESIRGFAKSCFEYALGKGWCAHSLAQLRPCGRQHATPLSRVTCMDHVVSSKLDVIALC